MDFPYADELKRRFDVVGHFYNLKIGRAVLPCRSVLEMFVKENPPAARRSPDAVVVMMNPGSSRPLDRGYAIPTHTRGQVFAEDWDKRFTPTRPDNAQYQIMRVMLRQGWEYVRVLNLSDLRNPNSGDFAKDFAAAGGLDASHPHCVTHARRANELAAALKTARRGPVIAAWGGVGVLRGSAEAMLRRKKNMLGWRIDPAQPWYRYASPYQKSQKLDWLREINRQIENR
ncbi:MAG: hypothetical protein ACYTGQ_01030 [Planctomycetota bacterium]|jgi:hypothetical protein